MNIVAIIIALVAGYACGSIPFGLIVTKLGGAPDPRTIGSHNIGATNVLRTGRKGLAAATLLFDALKGAGPVLVAARFGEMPALAAALGAFLGHLYPVWISFKGGKGVATFLGCLAGLAWPAAIVFALVWLGVAAALRYSSLAALCASLAAPIALMAMGRHEAAALFLALAALLYYRHRENIARLIARTETRIGGRA